MIFVVLFDFTDFRSAAVHLTHFNSPVPVCTPYPPQKHYGFELHEAHCTKNKYKRHKLSIILLRVAGSICPSRIDHEDLSCKCFSLRCLSSILAACGCVPLPARAGGGWSIACWGGLFAAVNMRFRLGLGIMLQVLAEASSRKRPTGGVDIYAIRCAAIQEDLTHSLM